MCAPWLCRWRVGRSIGRTIYAMVGAEASKADEVIGMLDSPELAAEAVGAHNAGLPSPILEEMRGHLADDVRRMVGREVKSVDHEVDEDSERLVFGVADGKLVLWAVRGALVALWVEV
jgi:hypothetical protein